MGIPEFLIQTATVFVALSAFLIPLFVSLKKDRRTANREIYQKLELASIDLFRFEADQIEYIRPVWEETTPLPQAQTAERVVVTNYICQMLNLFEMAIRFRKEKILPADVFASWISWIYELCNAPHFPEIWYETCSNYTKDLRVIINKGLKCTTSKDIRNSKKEFYEFIREHFKCSEIDLFINECNFQSDERD